MTRPSDDKDRTQSFAFADGADGPPRAVVFCEDTLIAYELPRRGRVVIGRTKECDIRIDHRSVSRAHAALHVEAGIAVEDLGSANGTRISGRLLAAHRPEPLASGAIVEMGLATLVVRGTGTIASAPQRVTAENPRAIADAPAMTTMDRLWRLVNLVAEGTLPVILLGETGVGKERMADAIHARSSRAQAPLVKINCAALPEALLESELFGHERGAFTGAVQTKPGTVEIAHRGTLFLDEVAELPLTTQAKLLRVVEAREVTRLGAVRPRAIDVRFVAATNRDLAGLVSTGAFRADLYHRLNGITLAIPPLRERVAEIASLTEQFVARASEQLHRVAPPIEREAIAWLERQPWPGNVRELRNVAERAVMLAQGAPIGIAHLQDPMARPAAPSADLRSELDALERARIEEALARVGGNQTKAAELLGISRRTLIGRLNAYGFPRPRRARERS